MVSPQGVGQALTLARRIAPHVVVDLEDCFHEEQLLTLRQASTVLVVSRLDFTSMRNARRILEHLASEADVARNRIHLVINRYGQPNELPMSEAEEALGGKISHCIPDDSRTVNDANNTGIPAVVKSPHAAVSQSLKELARSALDRRRTASGTGREAAPKKKWLPILNRMFAR
jgi:pilus assembly protein CpaE